MEKLTLFLLAFTAFCIIAVAGTNKRPNSNDGADESKRIARMQRQQRTENLRQKRQTGNKADKVTNIGKSSNAAPAAPSKVSLPPPAPSKAFLPPPAPSSVFPPPSEFQGFPVEISGNARHFLKQVSHVGASNTAPNPSYKQTNIPSASGTARSPPHQKINPIKNSIGPNTAPCNTPPTRSIPLPPTSAGFDTAPVPPLSISYVDMDHGPRFPPNQEFLKAVYRSGVPEAGHTKPDNELSVGDDGMMFLDTNRLTFTKPRLT